MSNNIVPPRVYNSSLINSSFKKIDCTFIMSCIEIDALDNNKYIKNDSKRLKYITTEGQMPKINWKIVQSDFILSLQQLLHRNVKVVSLDVTPSPMSYLLPIDHVKSIDIDKLLEDKCADAIFVHGEYMVYLATLKPSICVEIYSTACKKLSLSTKLSQNAINGIITIANADNMQAKQEVVYTANFGISERPQRNNSTSKNNECQSVTNLVGCPRGAYIPNTNKFFLHKSLTCISDVISSIYHHDFYPFFFNNNIQNEDKWYSSSTKRKPRFMKNGFLDQKKKLPLPYPLKSSLPPSSNQELIEAATIESNMRNISEWLLGNVFLSLPYSATAFIAEKNISEACNLDLTISLPDGIRRALPKGAIGFNRTKSLHDDGNAGIIPGIWSSHSHDKNVALHFFGRNMNVYLHTTMQRFCFFYGWIPHKTEINSLKSQNNSTEVEDQDEDSSSTCKKKRKRMDTVQRIHHSAFSKPMIEHISLSLLQPKFMKETVLSIKY